MSIYESSQFKYWQRIISDRVVYYNENKWHKKLFDLANKYIFEGAVDLGCGERGGGIGVDNNMDRLRNRKGVSVCADINYLPFKDKSINIFSSNTFEHLWYLKDAVLECRRVLKNKIVIVVPTEGGLWNLGRALMSKRYFKRLYPALDFDHVCHIEHCNVAKQIVRTIETFFKLKKTWIPCRVPGVYLNLFVKLEAIK